ncbi:hypothetical protein GLX27_003389 [Malassezia furfur]|uniref:Bromodomain associated domain-containing protein n=1 Tax=Malassezia furfur TaxID=55194 RepID=A0ABY8ET77_MALFU|nr:hypothetical protein GLX27_003389 [Malassezia furfur]
MGKDASGTVLRRVAPGVHPARDFAYAQLTTIVPMLLSAAGFHGGSANAVAVLAELVQRYVSLLARTAAACAADANRTDANVWDVAYALEDVMGTGALAELQEWADDEQVWTRDAAHLFPDAVQQQRARLRECTCGLAYPDLLVPPEKPAPTCVYYAPVSDAMQARLEVCRAKEEAEEDAWVWGDAPDTDTSTSETATDEATGDDLRTPSDTPYIPPYLPPLPDWDALAREAEEAMQVDDATPPPAVKDEAASAEPIARPPPPPALPAPGAGELDADGIRRIWRRRAPVYLGSLQEGAAPATELPSLDAALAQAGLGAPRAPPKSSSLDAFVHAYDELSEEAEHPVPVYLTSLTHSHHVNPNSAAFVDGAVKRRRLAHCFADPMRYVPNDSMHGCVYVHPASPAWVPGPSLLITIPSAQGSVEDSAHATPVFMPVHPHGRSVAMAPPSGALFPTLGYRYPTHLYTGMRIVAPPSLLRVFSRSGDPPALLDDHRTERVFHGMAASRTLMTGTMMSVQHRHSLSGMVNRYRGGNSILHPALERLRFALAAQLAEQRRQLRAEEQAEELEEEPIRGERIKMPIAGTLVYAWDWPTVLPWVGAEGDDARRPQA